MKKRFVLFIKLGCMICHFLAISGVLTEHQGNFVGPFALVILSILLFGAYFYDLCRLEHLGIEFLFVSCRLEHLGIQLLFVSTSCSEPVHIMKRSSINLKNFFVLSFIYGYIYFNSKSAMKIFA